MALLAHARARGYPVNVLGGGSNVVLPASLAGLTILVDIAGIEFSADRVTIAAGELWHRAVGQVLRRGLSGIENMSLIPGRVGAAPVQNIGAYGQELAGVFEELSAVEIKTGRTVCFSRQDCAFAYRQSAFKSHFAGLYIITSVTLRLNPTFAPALDYEGLRKELAEMQITDPTPAQVGEAVCRIRRRRLPDPAVDPNAGSFFKNPVVAGDHFARLRATSPGLTARPEDDGNLRLSAAQLIDFAGLKGTSMGNVAVSTQHALVLVNNGVSTSADVLALAEHIQERVDATFGVKLQIEPAILPLGG